MKTIENVNLLKVWQMATAAATTTPTTSTKTTTTTTATATTATTAWRRSQMDLIGKGT